ncbi:MAG: hypothetical protein JXR48_16530 [Candidatus Delongbacteria bacterium]|nr:hypothetical protein [Candidatus Delongbacteria bacterium]MBN2836565.1 hypothetical protein [Candidatus Delongbacteria bacterium]
MKKGVTLLEVLVASLISTITLTGIGMYMVKSGDLSNEIYLSTQAYAAMNIAARQIEESIKSGSLIEVPLDDDQTLNIFDHENPPQLILSYMIEDNALYRQYPGEEKEELIGYTDASFIGHFSVGSVTTGGFTTLDNRVAVIGLQLVMINADSITTEPMMYMAKCRNHNYIHED